MSTFIRLLPVWLSLAICVSAHDAAAQAPAAPAQAAPPANSPAGPATLESSIAQLVAAIPHAPAGFADLDAAKIVALATAVDYAQAAIDLPEQPAAILMHVERLLKAKAAVDRRLDATLKLRSELAAIEPAEAQRAALRNYLRVMSNLIDLSGRMRHWQLDVISLSAGDLATRPADREKLVDLLLANGSSIGAEVMAELLFDPPRRQRDGRPDT